MTYYEILVVAPTRHGWRRLRTFGQSEVGSQWMPADAEVVMDRRLDDILGAMTDGDGADATSNQVLDDVFCDVIDATEREAGLSRTSNGGRSLLRLSARVEVPAAVLSIVLDTVRGEDFHAVNVEDIKNVVSQYGSRICAADALPDDEREHAEKLLQPRVRDIVLRSLRRT